MKSDSSSSAVPQAGEVGSHPDRQQRGTRRYKGYRSIHRSDPEIQLPDESFELGVISAVVVVNWLHHTMATKELQWPPIIYRKGAVFALFHDPK
ncbi:hypothetical protein EC991_009392, partial [Linnemannia zychae]